MKLHTDHPFAMAVAFALLIFTHSVAHVRPQAGPFNVQADNLFCCFSITGVMKADERSNADGQFYRAQAPA